MLDRWKEWARRLKRSVFALYLAARHPDTPWYAKVLAALVAAYAFSPIDLIPDPIPVLGYLDDLILLPIGVWLTLKLIPPAIWAECRARAETEADATRPRSWGAAAVIIALWAAAIYLSILWLWPIVAR